MKQRKSNLRKIITLTDVELKGLLGKATKSGAKQALANIGLDDSEAAADIGYLRTWLYTFRIVKSEIFKAMVSVLIKSVLMAIFAGFSYCLY